MKQPLSSYLALPVCRQLKVSVSGYAQELYLCSSGLNKEVKEIDDKKG
jgi:hypothetical protein